MRRDHVPVSMWRRGSGFPIPALVDRVEAGDEIVLTRHGKPVAVLVSPAALRTRRAEHALAQAGELARLRREASDLPLSDLPGLDAARAERLVAAIRADRDR